VEGTTLIPFEPDTTLRFAEADVVICQAGYNTVAELEQVGTETLLLPAERQWDDQFARADKAMRARSNFHVFLGKTPVELATAIVALLREQTPNVTDPRPEGGIKAARLIYEMLR
jgi:predicted glycosyltransferase